MIGWFARLTTDLTQSNDNVRLRTDKGIQMIYTLFLHLHFSLSLSSYSHAFSLAPSLTYSHILIYFFFIQFTNKWDNLTSKRISIYQASGLSFHQRNPKCLPVFGE